MCSCDVLAKKVGLDFRHLAQVVVKTRHSYNILCLCWVQHFLDFGSVASHDLQQPPLTAKKVSLVSLSCRRVESSPPRFRPRQSCRKTRRGGERASLILSSALRYHKVWRRAWEGASLFHSPGARNSKRGSVSKPEAERAEKERQS